ncbi:hypothetical protein [Bartonella australis]|uniref:hypothetical protein n=1 Tax=Bartonella australis TaxID=388640 RepID=UPI0005A13E0B|nr:hypothetical protein [Bartonella australis]
MDEIITGFRISERHMGSAEFLVVRLNGVPTASFLSTFGDSLMIVRYGSRYSVGCIVYLETNALFGRIVRYKAYKQLLARLLKVFKHA